MHSSISSTFTGALLGLLALQLPELCVARRNLIIDTDIFSDCDDTGALLLAATSPDVNLLGVNVNVQSSYSPLAASAILAHYGHAAVPIGVRRPLNNDAFFDSFFYSLGEYASKVAYHHSGGTLPWGRAEDAWDPVDLYRKLLAEADDNSVTVASIGFLANLSALFNSTTGDEHSPLSGRELFEAKVSELVIMGGAYPSGREFNFFGDNPAHTAHVVNSLSRSPSSPKVVYCGYEVGEHVMSGMPLMETGPESDPVRAAYTYYTYRIQPRESWDPLTIMYAIRGLGDLFDFANEGGYNVVNATDGSNQWVDDSTVTNQHWLRLKVDNTTAAAELDRLYLAGAQSWAGNASAHC